MLRRDQKSTGVSDEMIVQFLLGTLSAAQRSTFEEKFITSDELDIRVHSAECALADDYAYGRLSKAERVLCEHNFLATDGRRNLLQVSRALRDRFAAPEEILATAFVRQGFGLRRPVFQFAIGLALLLALIGSAWLVIKKERRLLEAVTQPFPRDRPSPQRTPVESNHAKNSNSTVEHRSGSTAPPPHDEHVLNLTLWPRPPDAERQTVALPNSAIDILRLELNLSSKSEGPFRVEVLTMDNRSLFVAESAVPTPTGPIVLEVPTASLNAGDYQVKLVDVSNKSNSSVIYYFRVR